VKLSRRQSLHRAAGFVALPAASRIARAQTYPTRPVRWIVPNSPGDAPDVLARLVGQWLSERLGKPFIIDDCPLGATNVGTEAAVRSPPDGYTLVLLGPPAAINAALYDKLNFNVLRDIAPVATNNLGPTPTCCTNLRSNWRRLRPARSARRGYGHRRPRGGHR
jgi:tripartite-type tricarboxylate transporter receptor subunit TctC